MEKLNLKTLKALRGREKKKFNDKRDEARITTILVGMGTCGKAAGAGETLKAFAGLVEKLGLKDIEIKQTGCMGSCYVEPTVEIITPGMPAILYGGVTPVIAGKIMEEHIIKKQLLNDYVYDKPAIDILN
jgi:NADP-reducing hydrogenase subunit HndB